MWSGQLTRQLENKGEVLQYEGYLGLQDYYWNDDLGIFCMKKILACIFWVNWFYQGFFLFFFLAFLQVLETLATVVKQESDDENGKKGAVTTNVHGVIF